MAVRQSTPHTLWLESMTLRPMLSATSQVSPSAPQLMSHSNKYQISIDALVRSGACFMNALRGSTRPLAQRIPKGALATVSHGRVTSV